MSPQISPVAPAKSLSQTLCRPHRRRRSHRTCCSAVLRPRPPPQRMCLHQCRHRPCPQRQLVARSATRMVRTQHIVSLAVCYHVSLLCCAVCVVLHAGPSPLAVYRAHAAGCRSGACVRVLCLSRAWQTCCVPACSWLLPLRSVGTFLHYVAHACLLTLGSLCCGRCSIICAAHSRRRGDDCPAGARGRGVCVTRGGQ